MQRLFSGFANSWAGLGLLFQRIAVALALLDRVTGLFGDALSGPTWLGVSQVILSILIALGLWTPVVGALVAGTELSILFLGIGDDTTPAIVAVLGATLAMIGPGAWSIDALLFGRKHIAG